MSYSKKRMAVFGMQKEGEDYKGVFVEYIYP